MQNSNYTAKNQMDGSPDSSREIFRQCLRQADRFIIEGKFSEAKQQLSEAKKIDSRNPFIIAFEERIALFENKISTVHREPKHKQKEVEPQESAPSPEPVSREIIELQLRQTIEAEFKSRYTDELRKAEEEAAKLLEEEKIALNRQQAQLRERFDEQISESRKQLEEEFKKRLESETEALEEKLSSQHKNEILTLETKIKDESTARYREELEHLKAELEEKKSSVDSNEKAGFDERFAKLNQEHQARLQEAVGQAEEKIQAQYSEKLESERRKLSDELKGEYESQIRNLRQAAESATEKFEREKNLLLGQEASLKAGYDAKIAELKRDSEANRGNFEESAKAREEQIRERLRDEFNKSVKLQKAEYESQLLALETELKSSRELEQRLKSQHELNLTRALEAAEKASSEKGAKQLEKEREKIKKEFEGELKTKVSAEKKEIERLEQAIEAERNEFQSRQQALNDQHRKALEKALLDAEKSHKETLARKVEEERGLVISESRKELDSRLASENEKLRLMEERLKLDREEFAKKEQTLKTQHNQKLLEALRKTESMFRQQSVQQIEIERERITGELRVEFENRLQEEKKRFEEQNVMLREKLESDYKKRMNELEQENENRFRNELALLRKNQEEELARHRIALRQELEAEVGKEYDRKLDDERTRIQGEAASAIAEEKKKLDEQYNKLIEAQNAQVQKLRVDLRNEMEQALLSRLERIAYEFDHKMELLGARIPETKEDRYGMYRMKMLDCYISGQPSVAEARVLMQLKELLELTFDEHLAIEADVRLDLYVSRVEKMILSGELNVQNASALEKLKQQFSITPEEATRLEQIILASFQRLTKKGRILVVDDDELLLHSLDDLLTDSDYQVVTAPDIDTALEKLNNITFDLILSDIKFGIGDLDGFKFFKAVQERPHLRTIPFVFMSALVDGVIIRSGVQLGVDDYITKPMDPDLLIATIEGKLKRFRDIRTN